MEGMTRDRRVYHALETEDSQAYSRLLKERKESRAQYGRVAEARDSLLSYFPGLSCLCADTGLAAALEDVEEKYCALQQRHSDLQESAKKAQEQTAEVALQHAEQLSKAKAESSRLTSELADARQKCERLDKELVLRSQNVTQLQGMVEDQKHRAAEATTCWSRCKEQLEHCEVKLGMSEQRQADLETQVSEMQAEHSAAVEHLTSQICEERQLGAYLKTDLDATNSQKSKLEKWLEKAVAELGNLQQEHNGVRERLEAAETRAEGLEAAVSNSRAEQGLWKAKTEGAQQQIHQLGAQLQSEKDACLQEAAAKEEAIERLHNSEQQGEEAKTDIARLESQLAERDQLITAYKAQIEEYHADSQRSQEHDRQNAAAAMLQPAAAEGNGTQHIWDSAADIALKPGQDASSRAYEDLGEHFKDREGWQHVIDEGRAAGWLLSMDQVTKAGELGKGSFGTTYLGEHDGNAVAVKCVRIEREVEATTFLRELGALARLRHANIMAFLGAVVQPPRNCWLVVEYLPGGSLSQWLYGANNKGAIRRSLLEKATMGLEIAKGMLALEATDPPIMHRDLKPDNVLLDEKGKPKIADFGLCREHLEDEAYSYTGETGSYTYMSPEMMRGEMYDMKTDVYSYAILLTEIMKQKPPFEEAYLTPMQVAEGVAYHDLRPQLPGFVPNGMRYMLEVCWHPEPEMRPDFSTIVGHMMDIVSSIPAQKRGFFS